jgi:hypothetical protein
MSLDIYYSTESQDDFGIEEKTWILDQTLLGYAEILGAVEKDSLKNNMFFEYQNKLIGRTKEDPRVSSEAIYYPITSILITNIRDANTGTMLYVRNDGEPTIYEIAAVEPYVNPWNEIEYYKILFNRSDRQEIQND